MNRSKPSEMETDQVIAVRDNRQALQNALKAIGMPLKKVRTITSIDPALSKISSSELIPIFYESVDKVGEKLNLVSYQSKDACQEVQDWIPDVLCVLGGLKTIYNEGKLIVNACVLKLTDINQSSAI